MDVINTAFFAPERTREVLPRQKNLYWVIVVSVLLHVVLIALLASQERKQANTPEPQVAPIRATLIFTAPKPTPAAPPAVEPAIEPEPAESTPTEEVEALPEVTNADEIVPVESQPKEISEPAEPAPEAASQQSVEAPTNVPPPSTAQSADASSTPRTFSRQDALGAYFNASEDDEIQRMAAQASRQRRQQQTSPQIIDTRKDEPEEEITAPPPVNVDCSSTATKTLSILSRFTGGRVQCTSRGNDFEKFIEKRVNKGVKDDDSEQ